MVKDADVFIKFFYLCRRDLPFTLGMPPIWANIREKTLKNAYEMRGKCLLLTLSKFLRRGGGEGGTDLFSLGSSDRKCENYSNKLCENYSKLSQGRFGLNNRNHYFIKRVVRHWKRLPRQVVDAPSLSVFKRHLGTLLIMCFNCWWVLIWLVRHVG